MDRSKKTLGMFASTLVAGAGMVAPFVTLVAPASSVCAQVTDVEPYYVMVKEANVNMRCGAGQVWYAVGKVEQNQVLRVDGHEFGWLRVGYPSGMAAVVKANDAEYDPKTGAVTLVRESKLQANNPAGGVSESWRQLLDQPLPADSVLQHIETLTNSAGEVTGYRVAAPGGAKGFVSETLVRGATEEEVRAFLAAPGLAQAPTKNPEAQKPLAQQNPDANTSAKNSSDTSPEHAVAQAPTPDENDEMPAESDALVERDMDASDAPSTPEVVEPVRETVNRFPPPAADAPVEERVTPTESQPMRAGGESGNDPARTTTAQAPVGSYADLNRSFEEVMRQPSEGAEYGPLIGEFQRLIERLPDEPSSDSMRAAATGRIAALRLRADLQESLLKMNEALSDADQGSQRVEESAQTLNANPVYRFVGRLSSSTVYNGKRLPLLFRVQAVDSGRTLAYLTADPDLDLTAKLGNVVGVVVKQARDDNSLGLPLIDAKRVDVIKAERAGN